MVRAGDSQGRIIRALRVSPSTVSRELWHNGNAGSYDDQRAHQAARVGWIGPNIKGLVQNKPIRFSLLLR